MRDHPDQRDWDLARKRAKLGPDEFICCVCEEITQDNERCDNPKCTEHYYTKWICRDCCKDKGDYL